MGPHCNERINKTESSRRINVFFFFNSLNLIINRMYKCVLIIIFIVNIVIQIFFLMTIFFFFWSRYLMTTINQYFN